MGRSSWFVLSTGTRIDVLLARPSRALVSRRFAFCFDDLIKTSAVVSWTGIASARDAISTSQWIGFSQGHGGAMFCAVQLYIRKSIFGRLCTSASSCFTFQIAQETSHQHRPLHVLLPLSQSIESRNPYSSDHPTETPWSQAEAPVGQTPVRWVWN